MVRLRKVLLNVGHLTQQPLDSDVLARLADGVARLIVSRDV